MPRDIATCPYPFSPLASDQIRLFRFRMSPSRTILGDFRIVALKDAARDKFIAVSYCWGDKSSDHEIQIGRHKVGVISSIYTFLEMVCSNSEFVDNIWWWIDSICIDLDNKIERGSQVDLMGQIYSRANKVVVWLGERSEDSDDGMAFLDLLSKWDSSLSCDDEIVQTLRDGRWSEQWKAIGNLLMRGWWSRVWTLQEYTIAREAVFYCGNRSINRSQLKRAVSAMFRCHSYDGVLFDANAHHFAWNRRRLYQWHSKRGGKIPLVAMLAYFSNHKGTDPRDRIYSLLGLSTEADRQMVGTPDYSSDVQWIYSRLVESFVSTYQSLDILCLAHVFSDFSSRQHPGTALPSWVPDWRIVEVHPLVIPTMASQSHGTHIGNLRPLRHLGASVAYEASGSLKPRVSFTSDLASVTCTGVFLDFVDGLGGLKEEGGSCNSDDFEEHGHPSVQSNSIQNFPAKKEGYLDRPDIIHAVTECLVLGRRDKYLRDPAPSHFRDDFTALCLSAVFSPQNAHPQFLDWFKRNKSLCLRRTNLGALFKKTKTQVLATGSEKFQNRFLNTVIDMRRRLVVTKDGYIGMGPCRAERGDLICILLGCNIPVVLRKRGEETYQFIGECYLDGFMEGQIVGDVEGNIRAVQDFRLV